MFMLTSLEAAVGGGMALRWTEAMPTSLESFEKGCHRFRRAS